MLAAPFSNELLSTINRARAPSPERLPKFPILTLENQPKPRKMGVWSLMARGRKAPVAGEDVVPAQPKPQREKLQKPQNKLSKPRTNSSGNLLSVPNSANTSRKNSQTDLKEGLPRRSSSVPSRPSPGELELQHSQTLSERRLETALSRNSAQSNPQPDVGRGRGRPLEREGKEKKGRLSQFFRSRSSQAVPVAARQQIHELLQEEMPPKLSQAEVEAANATAANPLHRYSQHVRPPIQMTQHGSYNVRDILPGGSMNRASSYAPYHTHGLNRLSLVPEQPTPLATPAMEKELQLQHISETEDILSGRTSSNASKNPSRRQSMMSTTNSYRQTEDFQPSRTNSMRLESMTRVDSMSRLDSMTSENSGDAFIMPPIRRRSLMTPGVATRVEDPKYPSRQKLQKEPPKNQQRRMSVQPPVPEIANSSFFNKIRRSQTLPSDAESPDYYNSEEPPRESPSELLERLQPLMKPTFRKSLEMQRVNTPNDMGHIGGFKLGSLRITNGEVSPSATPRYQEKGRDVEYFGLQRAAMTAPQLTASDPTVRTMQAMSTQAPTTQSPAELSGVSPERAPRPSSKGHSFSFEQARFPLVEKYDDSRILELRPPKLSTYDLAESYRLELDFTTPFFESPSQSPEEVGTEKLPELSRTEGGLLTPGNGRRQPDELFMSEDPVLNRSKSLHESKQLLNVMAQQPVGLAKTDSGYSSHTSLNDAGKHTDVTSRRSPAPPAVPKKHQSEASQQSSYQPYSAYSARSITSMDSDRTPKGAMSPLPAEPEPPTTPPKEKPTTADFWKTQHAPRTPKPISKVEDLTRKPVHSSPSTQQSKDSEATPKARPPIPRQSFMAVEPVNLRSSTDTAAGDDREPIKVVRYTSVKEGPKPSLVDSASPKRKSTQRVLQKESTHKVLQKATGRPPLAVRVRSGSTAANGELTRHKRSDSTDSMQSLRNFVSGGGSRRNSRSNSIDRGQSGPVEVQKVTDIEPGSVPQPPKMKDRSNRFSINHAKNLWSESEQQKEEKMSQKESEKEKKVIEKESEKQQKVAEKENAKNQKAAEKEMQKRISHKVKADKKDKKANPPPADEIEKSIRQKSLPASTPSERALQMLAAGPDLTKKSWRSSFDGKADKSLDANEERKRDIQVRKEFEQEITSFEMVAGALGASPYDLAMRANAGSMGSGGNKSSSSSSDSSLSTIKPKNDKPARHGPTRDQSGRIVGMDEASASQFARNRSQIRAQEMERREALRDMALVGTPLPEDVDEQNHQKAFAPQIGNSSFAKQLAAQAGNNMGQKKRPTSIGAPPDAPPMPVLNLEEVKHKRIPHGKAKKAAGGPPVAALNGIRKRNSGKGRHNMGMFGRQRELSTQIEMPERFAPQPPTMGAPNGTTDSSASSVSLSGSEASITTPMSQPESSTSVSSDGSETARINAKPKTKTGMSLFPNITVPPVGTANIDGILDAVLAPMTPSPTKSLFDAVERTKTPDTSSFTMSSPHAQASPAQSKPNIFGTRAPPPVSPSAPSFDFSSQAQTKPNIFGTRAPPPVSPSNSTFSSGTTYLTPNSHLSPFDGTHSPGVSSPLNPASPVRPRLQSAMSSRSSNGSSPSSYYTANGSSGEKKKVAISTAPATILTPSMAPRWQGPSPSELAEMAMAAKQGASSKGKEAVRSHSSQSSYDGGKGKGVSDGRPSSEQGTRPKNEKRRSFGMGSIGGSKLKSSVEA